MEADIGGLDGDSEPGAGIKPVSMMQRPSFRLCFKIEEGCCCVAHMLSVL